MKKYFLFLVFVSSFAFSQKRISFPYQAMLKDTKGAKVSSATFYNFGKPLIIEIFGTYCKPCIKLLDSFKEEYATWQKEYGVKIIVVVVESKSKKALKMIEEHEWPFQFYFDHNRKLYRQIQKGDRMPQTLIFDGKFNKVEHSTKIDPNYIFKYKKETRSFEKRIQKHKVDTKYSHLEMDLIQYEKVLRQILE